jgi:hypothetical protein
MKGELESAKTAMEKSDVKHTEDQLRETNKEVQSNTKGQTHTLYSQLYLHIFCIFWFIHVPYGAFRIL